MTTVLGFKPGIDRPMWFQASPHPITNAAALGAAWDHRNDVTRIPIVWYLTATTTMYSYNTQTDGYVLLPTPALSGTAAGTALVFHPSQGPRGTLTTGNSTTLVVLSTALPSAVGTNQLANRGDGVGYTIRIYNNSAGQSGKTEESIITANTSGTTPSISVNPAFSFTPNTGDTYEILSGKVYMLGSGAIGASTWKSYDVATGTIAGLSQTNLAATIATDSSAIAFSELHVSNDRKPGAGFMDTGSSYNQGNTAACSCSAVSNNTITCGALTNPSSPSLFTNEYAQFQVRVVYDPTNPTAVGQRRTISSHTSGNTPVFTISVNWTVNPSTSALFVVENQDNLILLRTSANTTVYSYSISGNAWTTSLTAAGSANGAGNYFEQCFGITRDATGNRRHSHCFFIRGGASAALDIYDLAGNAWTNGATYSGSQATFTTGTSAAYDPVTNGGKYLYINVNGTAINARLDMFAQAMIGFSSTRYPQSTAVVGQRLFMSYFMDGSVKLGNLFQWISSTTAVFATALGF
jgi:hypothetical protein